MSRPVRLLSFDGGGLHGLTYLPLIHHLEEYLGAGVRTSGQFRMLAGTSTGSIVATSLRLGVRASKIQQLYEKHAAAIFNPRSWWNQFFCRYSAEPLHAILRSFFAEELGAENVTWNQAFPATESAPELIITLWDVSSGEYRYLSSDPSRSARGRATELRDAPLADIVTAACSAPYYFPPRAFRLSNNEERVFCDGGISGLNNPSAYGVALLRATGGVESDAPIYVASFGAGAPEPGPRFTPRQIRRWTAINAGLHTIDALMSSSGALMHEFHVALGTHLDLKTYFRTDVSRSRNSRLDDISGIPGFVRDFAEGRIRFELWRDGVLSSDGELDKGKLEEVWRDALHLNQSGLSSPGVASDKAVAHEISDPTATPTIRSHELRPNWRSRLDLLTSITALFLLSAVTVASLIYFWHKSELETQLRRAVSRQSQKLNDLDSALHPGSELAALSVAIEVAETVAPGEAPPPAIWRGLAAATAAAFDSRVVHEFNSAVHSIRFNDGGDTYLTLTVDGVFRFWRANDHESVGPNIVSPSPATSFQTVLNGAALAATGADGILRVWSTSDARLLLDAPTCPDGNCSICQWTAGSGDVEPTVSTTVDGQVLLATGGCGYVTIWNCDSWTQIWQWKCPDCHSCPAARLSPDGMQFAVIDDAGFLHLADIASRTIVATQCVSATRDWFSGAHANDLASVADSRVWITASWPGGVQVWDSGLSTSATSLPVSDQTEARKLVTRDSDSVVAIVLRNGFVSAEVCLWDLKTGRALKGSPSGDSILGVTLHRQLPLAVGFNPAFNRQAVIWNFETGVVLRRIEHHRGPVTAAEFVPGTTLVLTGSSDGTVRLSRFQVDRSSLTIGNGDLGRTRREQFQTDGIGVEISSDGATMRIKSQPSELYDLRTCRRSENRSASGVRWQPLAHADSNEPGWLERKIKSRFPNPDAITINEFVTAAGNSDVAVVDIAVDRAAALDIGASRAPGAVMTGAFLTTLMYETFDYSVELWSLKDQRLIAALPKRLEAVSKIAISADGTMLATHHYGGVLRLWRMADSPELLAEWVVPSKLWATALAFSPDDRSIILVSLDAVCVVQSNFFDLLAHARRISTDLSTSGK